jgi:hypothetical protein
LEKDLMGVMLCQVNNKLSEIMYMICDKNKSQRILSKSMNDMRNEAIEKIDRSWEDRIKVHNQAHFDLVSQVERNEIKEDQV